MGFTLPGADHAAGSSARPNKPVPVSSPLPPHLVGEGKELLQQLRDQGAQRPQLFLFHGVQEGAHRHSGVDAHRQVRVCREWEKERGGRAGAVVDEQGPVSEGKPAWRAEQQLERGITGKEAVRGHKHDAAHLVAAPLQAGRGPKARTPDGGHDALQ